MVSPAGFCYIWQLGVRSERAPGCFLRVAMVTGYTKGKIALSSDCCSAVGRTWNVCQWPYTMTRLLSVPSDEGISGWLLWSAQVFSCGLGWKTVSGFLSSRTPTTGSRSCAEGQDWTELKVKCRNRLCFVITWKSPGLGMCPVVGDVPSMQEVWSSELQKQTKSQTPKECPSRFPKINLLFPKVFASLV